MKISKLKCLFLFSPFERPLGNSLVFFQGKCGNVIQLVTDEGVIGYGEAYGDQSQLYKLFNELFPSLIGINFDSWELVQKEIRRSLEGRVAPYVLGCIESAFNLAYWDIQGKMAGKSVCQLFGAEPIDQIPIYGTGLFYRDVEDYQKQLPFFMDEMQGFVDRGYHGIKMKAGRYPVEQEAWLIGQVRKEMPAHMQLMVDANCGMRSVEETKDLVKRLEDLGIYWLEEPFKPDQYGRYQEITKNAKMSIAAGENEYSLTGFEQLIESKVSILQPELSLCGGFSQIPALIELAKQAQVPLTPHVWGSGMLYAATLQFYSMTHEKPTFLYECPFLDDPLRDYCFDSLTIQNGYIDTPKKPGLGVEINEEVMKKYLINF
ncbi:mandelate racemase/muconate lactonizing enzyme family protein [Ammoniphilus resinae]|uniref:D-galactarolactone cycloisomerase n=1 Tax=Ammoniphilus resinae TaxID=861532 RepID=A0ABS4GQ30_9BACL|nr:mandelate racemase/muconate lactonizing enzyme family protein [Ammoniphilus resinae]MBP1932369.1 D-galactarolactone cycloisomerase [Ammoniphilus resinae]